MSDFQQAQRRLLSERSDRLLKLIGLRAPQSVIEMSAGLLIRGIVGSVGPGALSDLGKWMIESWKRDCGVCPFCAEERPIITELAPSGRSWGMCADCLAEVAKADAEADELEQLAEAAEEVPS